MPPDADAVCVDEMDIDNGHSHSPHDLSDEPHFNSSFDEDPERPSEQVHRKAVAHSPNFWEASSGFPCVHRYHPQFPRSSGHVAKQ